MLVVETDKAIGLHPLAEKGSQVSAPQLIGNVGDHDSLDEFDTIMHASPWLCHGHRRNALPQRGAFPHLLFAVSLSVRTQREL